MSTITLLTWEYKYLSYNYQMSHGLCLKLSNAQAELANRFCLPKEESQEVMKTHKSV